MSAIKDYCPHGIPLRQRCYQCEELNRLQSPGFGERNTDLRSQWIRDNLATIATLPELADSSWESVVTQAEFAADELIKRGHL